MFSNIVVGVDRHQGGRDAVALAKQLLDEGGELTLAHVLSRDAHTSTGSPTEYGVAKRERTAELLEAASKKAGGDANLRWRESSSVGRGLHDLCEVIGADLLVVGSSRHGLLG